MNRLGKRGIPFLFIIDFEVKNPIVLPLDEIYAGDIQYAVNNQNNALPYTYAHPDYYFIKKRIDFEDYQIAFDKVKSEINFGNTYLTNLTFPTEITTNLSLQTIFDHSTAKYKLRFKDDFVVFSPEIFVQIKNGIISSNPMKGTIDADLPNARQLIMEDTKEIAEHHTIVDLIRNDLNLVSKDVRVEQFRYIDLIKTNSKNLLQVSSKITGQLPDNYKENIGTILSKLLPAGSISGAPKKKTIEIIKASETYERGYYTGVFGIFDGNNLDSGVMIRFIEKQNGKLYFKSGGGITTFSDVNLEYQELTDKIYVPITRKHQDQSTTNTQIRLPQ